MHRSNLVFTPLATLAIALAFGQSSNAQTLTTLLSFNGTNGKTPEGNLTVSGSTLYGMTENGGANGFGAIFSLPISGGTPTTMFSFNIYDLTYGGVPQAGFVLNGSTLYGTTSTGGPSGYGTVFSESTSGGTPTVLASFNGSNGIEPRNSLTLSANGSTLYGMTENGGPVSLGTIFSTSSTGGTITDLTTFNANSGTGEQPFGGLILSGSTLYGMTTIGGTIGVGTIFSEPVTGGTPTILASFNITDGSQPYGNLTLIGSTLYGMTTVGGAHNDGTIFSIPTSGGTPNTLVSFNGTDGQYPFGDLTLIGSTFYGMTRGGGANGDGTIFSVPITGGTPTTLFSFNGTNGASPYGDLTLLGTTFYGMTSAGGTNGDGTVFALALVPEPSSVVLLALGAIGLAATARRRAACRQAA